METEKNDFSQDICDWAGSNVHPKWQHELLRVLAEGRFLSERDISCFADKAINEALPKISSWFTPPEATVVDAPRKLKKDDFKIRSSTEAPVILKKIEHISGVNRLKNGAFLDFDSEAMTVVFGPNGSGKSGYTRILKQFAASRGVELILPNAIDAPGSAGSASVAYIQGDDEKTLKWVEGQDAEDSEFRRVRVFDTRAASSHIQDANEVAYVPPQLVVLSEYVEALSKIKIHIENQRLQHNQKNAEILQFGDDRLNRLVEKLGTKEAKSVIEEIEEFSQVDEKKLENLKKELLLLKAESPDKLARRASTRINIVKSVHSRIGSVKESISELSVEKAHKLRRGLDIATSNVTSIKASLSEADRLGLNRSSEWSTMLGAAVQLFEDRENEYSAQHPTVDDWIACPLCQQELDEDSKERLRKFKEFLTGNANEAFTNAQNAFDFYSNRLDDIASLVPDDKNIEKEVREISDQLELDDDQTRLLEKNFIDFWHSVKNLLGIRRSALEGGGDPDATENSNYDTYDHAQGLQVDHSGSSCAEGIDELLRSLLILYHNEMGKQLKLAEEENGSKAIGNEIIELEYRKSLAENRNKFRVTHDRKLWDQAYADAVSSCSPTKATNLVKKLSKSYIDQVLHEFQGELTILGFDPSIPIALTLEKTSRGVSFIKVKFNDEKRNHVERILSEGEQRVVSLAGFFADLTGTEDMSCLVFDDPVSSLDHRFRSKVAERLVKESACRQVVVFSHDYAFVRLLKRAHHEENLVRRSNGDKLLPEIAEKEIARKDAGSGVLVDYEWRQANLKKQIGALKKILQDLESLERKSPDCFPEESRNFLCAIRETWERVVEEVLLNGVVVRLDPAVHTQKLKPLFDISEEDLATVELGMTVESRLMAGHSDPGEIGYERFPDSGCLRAELDRLVNFRDGVNSRRKN
ncbi:AAA family ATPase [Corynebacterium antarcticum]|uniref:AAA family ATPase n=1 Tax=Corynebacterium antarcticum TaxID=2800405 RepID=UPI002260BDBA|nr:hypothetical protein [Corynebacterium antarcticum]MCX7540929.1 hypothetical protein [Corynebacterium antarcticum]